MHVGQTLFAQVMEFVPWKTFGRIVERHKGDAGVRTLGCAGLSRAYVLICHCQEGTPLRRPCTKGTADRWRQNCASCRICLPRRCRN